MILKTEHHTTATWDKPNDKWCIMAVPHYRWYSKNEESPLINNFDDALQWIIKHDEQK